MLNRAQVVNSINAKDLVNIGDLNVIADIADDAQLPLNVRNSLRNNERIFVATGFTHDDANNARILNDDDARAIRLAAIQKRNALRMRLVREALARLTQVNNPALTALATVANTEADIRNVLLNTPAHKAAFGLGGVANLNDMPIGDLAELRQVAINRVNELKVRNAIAQMNATNAALTALATVVLPGGDANDVAAISNVLAAHSAQFDNIANPEQIPVAVLRALRTLAISKERELTIKTAINVLNVGDAALTALCALRNDADAAAIRGVLTGANRAQLGNFANLDDLSIEQLREIQQTAVRRADQLRKNDIVTHINALDLAVAVNVALLRAVMDADPRDPVALRTAIAAARGIAALAGLDANGRQNLPEEILEDLRVAAFAKMATVPNLAQSDQHRLSRLRELLNNSASTNEIIAVIRPLNAAPNALLATTDQYLRDTLAKLQLVAGDPARQAEVAPTMRNAKIALEMHLLQPLRRILNGYVRPDPLPAVAELIRAAEPVINRIKAANGLAANHALRQALATFETVIRTAGTTPAQAAAACGVLHNEMLKSQLSILRRTLELSEENRNAALPDVIDQLLMPVHGLPARHPLCIITPPAASNPLTQLKDLVTEYNNAKQALNTHLAVVPPVDADVDAARARLNAASQNLKPAIKNVREGVSALEKTLRERKLNQQRAGFTEVTNTAISNNVDAQFVKYTERAELLADRSKSIRHSRIREDLMPALTREAEELQQQFLVYQPALQTAIDHHLAAQKFTLAQQEVLTVLRNRLTALVNAAVTQQAVIDVHDVLEPALAAAKPGSPLHTALSRLKVSVDAGIMPALPYVPPATLNADIINALPHVARVQQKHLLGQLQTALEDILAYPDMYNGRNFGPRLEADFLSKLLQVQPAPPAVALPPRDGDITDPALILQLTNLRTEIANRDIERHAVPSQVSVSQPILNALRIIANALPAERNAEENTRDVERWEKTREAQETRMQRTNANITKLDTALNKGDRADMKPLRVLNFSDTCELVAKDQVARRIQELTNPLNAEAGLRGHSHGKTTLFNDNQALLSTKLIQTGLGLNKASTTVVTEHSNINGRYVAKMHFDQTKLKSSLFGGIDGYTKWAVKDVQDFLATSSNPSKGIELFGNSMPRELVREIVRYCALKGIKYVNHTGHEVKVTDGLKKELSDRVKRLFPDHPDFATSVEQEQNLKTTTRMNI